MRRSNRTRFLLNTCALAGSLALTVAVGLALAVTTGAFDPNDQPVGYVAMPEVTSHQVAGGDQTMFSIDYDGQTWSGNLHAYPISANGQITPADIWAGGAAGMIDAQAFDTGRKIFTAGGQAFTWAAMTTAQRANFGDATTGPKVVNFLRGDRTNEAPAGSLRTRETVLGDVIHSTPVYHSYGTAATVFVGANDGMLHAIDASSGVERYAYVPAVLMPRMGTLASPAYTGSHEYFVDGNLAVRAFTVGGTTKVLLAGTLGGGGQALFGLDVSTPAPATEAAAAAAALWEVTPASTGFANLGYTYASPVLATLTGGTPALVVGNGYNNLGNGQASLFIINALTGALIHEISTNSGTVGSPNGLSSARVIDTDGDGYVDVAYAGDLAGQLWKFDLVAHTATLLLTTSPAQSITTTPVVAVHPYGGNMVAFATGRMLTTGDASDTATHYAYGVWDGAPVGNTTLVSQTLTESTYSTGSTRVRTATGVAPDWTNGHDRGWKTALPIGGERVVGPGAVAQGGAFVFMSTNPTANLAASPTGENWWMQLNLFTGGDNNSVYFDLDADGIYDETDKVSVGAESLAPVGKEMGGGVRSQFIVLTAAGSDVLHASYDINSGGAVAPVDPGTPVDRGVSGGHFDFDLYCYSTTCYDGVGASEGSTLRRNTNSAVNSGMYWTHVHEYDDIYDVTGVNTLNASQALLNLSKALGTTTSSSSSTTVSGKYLAPTTTTTSVSNPTATSTQITTVTVTTSYSKKKNKTTTTTETRVTSISQQFKILVANQAYSPAAKITVGGAGYVNVTSYGTAAGLTVASLPTYSYPTIGSLAINLPLDAFKSKNWGTGVVRAGLHPAYWSCVVQDATDGPSGERRNGALLIQVIKSTTADSDIQLNVAGRPDLGYRLKNGSLGSKLLAEYTMFWHHPNNKCMGSSGWTMAPPEDTVSDATAATAAAGSDDPADGIFSVGSSGTSGTGAVVDPVSGTGGASTGTGSGTGVSTGVGVGGSQVDATNSLLPPGTTVSVVNGENKSKEKLGRASWRQLLD